MNITDIKNYLPHTITWRYGLALVILGALFAFAGVYLKNKPKTKPLGSALFIFGCLIAIIGAALGGLVIF